jgi:hypothetical protein
LTEYGLGLHADAVNSVDDHERTVGNTEGGRDLGRKVNVTGTLRNNVCKL